MKTEKEMHEEERRLALMETESLPEWEKTVATTIEQMRDVLAEDEAKYIQSLSNDHKTLLSYIRGEIISRYSDDEVRKEHRRILLEL